MKASIESSGSTSTVLGDALQKAEMTKKKREEGMVIVVPEIRDVRPAAKPEAISRAVEEARKYLTVIPNHMLGLVNRIREIQTASVEEKAIRQKEFQNLVSEVLSHLNSQTKLLASAACQAYALAMVSTLPADKRLVEALLRGSKDSGLPGLLELKFLEQVKTESGNAVHVKVYGNIYRINGARDFSKKLANAIVEGATRASKAAHDLYHGEVEGLKAQGTISIAELLAGKPGEVFMNVPDDKTGEKFLSGGALLAKSNGAFITTSLAVGHFQRIMTEIADSEVAISVDSLKEGRIEAGGMARIFHAILRRGIAKAQSDSQKQTN